LGPLSGFGTSSPGVIWTARPKNPDRTIETNDKTIAGLSGDQHGADRPDRGGSFSGAKPLKVSRWASNSISGLPADVRLAGHCPCDAHELAPHLHLLHEVEGLLL